MPYTRALGDELFEMRAIGKEGIVRVFYCMVVRGNVVRIVGLFLSGFG